MSITTQVLDSFAPLAPILGDNTVAVCADCVDYQGLCYRHAIEVLPQLAQPGWIRLIGAPLVEQKKRQNKRLSPKDERAVAKAERRNSRKEKRRGLVGLIHAIKAAA